MITLLLAVVITGVLGLGIGGFLGTAIGGISKKTNAVILSFSAGTMIALICFELVHEAVESGLSTVLIALILLLSAGLVAYLDFVVDSGTGHKDDFIACEDCDEKGLTPNRTNTKIRTREVVKQRSSRLQFLLAGCTMAAAIALHNIPEGMSVGALYSKDGLSNSLIALLFSILLHNIPEGMAIAISLTTSGMNRWKATGIAALSGVPTVVGAILGYFLGNAGGSFGAAAALSFAAGTLAYVVFGEILPQSIKLYSSRKTAYAAIAGFVVGFLIIGTHMHG